MTIIVEDGSGVTGANSYQSLNDWQAYADAHGFDYSAKTDEEAEAALIRATTWLDNNYRARWLGVRTYGNLQMLLWPRKQGIYVNGTFYQNSYLTTITDAEGVAIAINEIPSALIAAHAEATWRELVTPGSLAPDEGRDAAIHRLQAGSVSIEYSVTAPTATTFTIIDQILSALLASSDVGFIGMAVRG